MMDLILIITCLITLTIAASYDLKWRYVPDYASYSFIIIAIIERILYAIEISNPNVALWAIPASLILTGFGYVLYRGGLWGGGDVKIIASTSILIAYFPLETIPLFIDFFMNLMIIGALYIVPATILIGIKRKIRPDNKEKTQMAIGILIAITLYIIRPMLSTSMISIGILIVTSIQYLRRVEKEGLIVPANMKTLMDGDWLVEKIKVGKKTIKPKKQGLTKEEAALIKKWWKQGKLKKKPLIKEGIAYLPAFLIAFLTTITFSNLMILIVSEGLTNSINIAKLLY